MYIASKSLAASAAVNTTLQQGIDHLCHKYLTFVLLFLCVISTFSLIYYKDLYRRSFLREQTLVLLQQKMQIRWEQLLLEKAAVSSERHIHSMVLSKLTMHIPRGSEVMLLKL